MKVKNVLIPSFLGSMDFYQKNITKSVDWFIDSLVELAGQQMVSSDMGITITKRNGDSCVLADIESGVGCARVVQQGWRLDGDSQLEAVIMVERQLRDKYDAIFWEPVIHVYVPANSSLYFNGEEGKVVVSAEYGPSKFGFYDFIQMALVGIISGPLYCE